MPKTNVGFFVGMFLFMIFTGAWADIDIFSTGSGFRIQDSSGNIIGNVGTRAQAQKVADIYAKNGQKINWRTSTVTTTGGMGTGAGTGTTTSNTTVSTSRQLTGGGSVPRQITGGSAGTAVTTTGGGSNLPATTVKGTNLPATTGGGSNLPATTGGNATGGAGGGSGGGGNTGGTSGTSAASRVNVGGAALGVLGMIGGGVGLYESVAGTDKATWGDVGAGALSGASFAAGAAAFVNAIPVGGQIAYGGALLVGSVVGTLGAGAEMFSETDCERDPVLGIYACCNISKLSNIDAYRAEIGDKMFAEFPYVRYCVQGKKEYKEEQPWLKGRFLDDHWSANTEVGLCPGYSVPENQEETHIQLYAANDANVGFCWMWECADAGYTRVGGKCVDDNDGAKSSGGSGGANGVIKNNVIGTNCEPADLPQYATAGTYIDNGIGVVCAATACQNGTYLVVNSSGASQGWCVASTYCTDANTALNIIDGNKTDLQCIANDIVFGGELDEVVVIACSNATLDRLNATAAVYNQNIDDCVPTACKDGYRLEGTGENAKCFVGTDTRNECERGVTGYIVFEGVCMPTAQMQQILSQRAAQSAQQQAATEIANLQSQINRYAGKIQDIEDAHADDKVSVWKNAEGKFNTSRLLSDSIAGVALGTVGGLVVNKIVKDKHIETGFEELGCAIDGEKIADFDDVFTINGAVDKDGCVGNNVGYGNVFVWAAQNSDGTDYARMIEDVNNPQNNACWVRVDIESDNIKINVSDIPSRWFMVGQRITCGAWTNRDTLRKRALDARKSGRVWASVGGAVGGAGLGVGIMELFGNRLIGGKVMGQKSLDEIELLYSQMSETERREYAESMEKLSDLCDELYQKGGTSSWCE